LAELVFYSNNENNKNRITSLKIWNKITQKSEYYQATGTLRAIKGQHPSKAMVNGITE